MKSNSTLTDNNFPFGEESQRISEVRESVETRQVVRLRKGNHECTGYVYLFVQTCGDTIMYTPL